MEITEKKINLNEVDLLSLKSKGLSNIKISKMYGVPTEKIDIQVKDQEQYKKYSGVY